MLPQGPQFLVVPHDRFGHAGFLAATPPLADQVLPQPQPLLVAERSEAPVEGGGKAPVGIAHAPEQVAAVAEHALAEQFGEEVTLELEPALVLEDLDRAHIRSLAPAASRPSCRIPPTACTRHGCST